MPLRREVLIGAVKRVATDLRESGVVHWLRNDSVAGKSRAEQVIFFQVFNRWSVATAEYGETERKILEIFKIDMLLDPQIWPELQLAATDGEIGSFAARVENAADHAQEIVQLLTQDYREQIKQGSDDLPLPLVGKDLLTAIVAEEDGAFSSPDRIVIAIKAISDLYFVHATIAGSPSDDLIMLSCDSGSDKSFDFAGAGRNLSSVKETIIALWDRVVFHRHAQAGATVDLIARALPVLAQIGELESEKRIAPELAEQLRRKTMGASSRFIESGVIIPEMEREATHSPRVLMAPEPKLLAAPLRREPPVASDQTAETVGTDPVDDEQDVAGQIQELKRRLAAAEKAAGRSRTAKRPRAKSNNPDR